MARKFGHDIYELERADDFLVGRKVCNVKEAPLSGQIQNLLEGFV